jgi:hypothetical protein
MLTVHPDTMQHCQALDQAPHHAQWANAPHAGVRDYLQHDIEKQHSITKQHSLSKVGMMWIRLCVLLTVVVQPELLLALLPLDRR